MTREEAINVIENEKTCVLRDSCERSECASCELVMPIERILSAYDMAVVALREQEELENPKPLTLDDMREIYDKSEGVVWLRFGGSNSYWPAIMDRYNGELVAVWAANTHYLMEEDYGKTWLAYRSKPKEE